MNLVFMGTPDFASTCLESLVNGGHNVKAVFSQPDKPVGRHKVMTPPDVKVLAQKLGIPVYQPATLRDGEAEKIIDEINPDCVVVVAYGKLIPPSMLSKPKYGYINVHASLLPKYRGAAPIQWAVVDGEKQTGVTTMLLDEGMDTGDILEMTKTPIGEDETAGELFERLSVLGGELILSTLEKLEKGEIVPTKQKESEATYASIIDKNMALIDFNNSAKSIKNLIRGFNPWPIAYTVYEGKRLKIFSASVGADCSAPIGSITDSQTLSVCCGEGTLIINELQLEGSKRMTTAEFIKGRKIPVGTKLG